MPRRVSTYAPHLQALNNFVSVSAFVLGASMLVFLANLIWSLVFVRAARGGEPVARRAGSSGSCRRRSRSTNFDRIPVITARPVRVRRPDAPPVADLGPRSRRRRGS